MKQKSVKTLVKELLTEGWQDLLKPRQRRVLAREIEELIANKIGKDYAAGYAAGIKDAQQFFLENKRA